MTEPWNILIGKQVVSLFVSDDESFLKFECVDGSVVFETYGDCCSETWFADIVGVHALLKQDDWRGRFHAAIDKIEILDVPPVEDGRGRQESDQHYGVKLSTKNDSCYIIYRNSSNGYYGGEVNLYTGSEDNITWKQIKDDWRA